MTTGKGLDKIKKVAIADNLFGTEGEYKTTAKKQNTNLVKRNDNNGYSRYITINCL